MVCFLFFSSTAQYLATKSSRSSNIYVIRHLPMPRTTASGPEHCTSQPYADFAIDQFTTIAGFRKPKHFTAATMMIPYVPFALCAIHCLTAFSFPALLTHCKGNAHHLPGIWDIRNSIFGMYPFQRPRPALLSLTAQIKNFSNIPSYNTRKHMARPKRSHLHFGRSSYVQLKRAEMSTFLTSLVHLSEL